MIDVDPTDMTCIYSTLSFISDQASRYEYTPIITFDQPLWWKSLKIVSNELQDSKLKSIILRLGGLQVEMSFLGCIGHITAGSGIEEVLELVYAKNAVPHILSGKAERTGNWMLRLKALHEMLPYFAAAGHTLYCQQMQDLPNTHTQVNRSFLNGLHVVRRSDRFWAGLSTDLIIEQVLMRSMKTTGGLTKGTGMSETQRLVWLMSMPSCADINNSMQNLTATGNVCLQPENLPPTSSAASFHSLRVYLQVQEWKQNQLRPQDWGWRLSDGRLLPILTDRPPAHQSLLEMIRSNCRTYCNTQRCSCKKHGLECSSACEVCKGESWLNSSAPDLHLGLDDA